MRTSSIFATWPAERKCTWSKTDSMLGKLALLKTSFIKANVSGYITTANMTVMTWYNLLTQGIVLADIFHSIPTSVSSRPKSSTTTSCRRAVPNCGWACSCRSGRNTRLQICPMTCWCLTCWWTWGGRRRRWLSLRTMETRDPSPTRWRPTKWWDRKDPDPSSDSVRRSDQLLRKLVL